MNGVLAARKATLLRCGIHATGLLHRPDHLVFAVLPAALHHGGTMASALRIGASRFGARPAFTDRHGTLSFAALEQGARRLAATLTKGGQLGPGMRVGVACGDHRGFILAVGAASLAGADVVLLGPNTRVTELSTILQAHRIATLFHDRALASRVQETGWRGTTVSSAAMLSLIRDAAPAVARPRARRRSRLTPLTTGTTGTPRGVDRHPPGLSQALAGLSLLGGTGITPESVVLNLPPLFHGHGFAIMAAGLACGAHVIVAPSASGREVIEIIADHKVEVVVGVPTQLFRIVTAAEHPEGSRSGTRIPPAATRNPPELGTVCSVVSGSGPLSAELSQRLQALFGNVLRNFYGSTETGTATVALPTDLARNLNTVGRPIAGVRVEIRNGAGEPLPPGHRGQVHIGSTLSFTGYSAPPRQPGRSLPPPDSKPNWARLRHSPPGLVPTGDLGWFNAHGLLFLAGRSDDIVGSGGENVHRGEVQEFLLSLTGVAAARVFPVPDAEFGTRLHAEVVASPGYELDPAMVKELVRVGLARHKVPQRILVVSKLSSPAADG